MFATTGQQSSTSSLTLLSVSNIDPSNKSSRPDMVKPFMHNPSVLKCTGNGSVPKVSVNHSHYCMPIDGPGNHLVKEMVFSISVKRGEAVSGHMKDTNTRMSKIVK